MKTYILKFAALLLLVAAFVAGCNKEESPFAGNDNYIAAFTLVKDGVTLKGAISPDAIVITAPEQLSLSGATATVTLSENATITPDPATITDWNMAQTFTVTAYNGTAHRYDYSVERRLISRNGDVVLLTQADVEAFVEEVKDIDQINGSITIGAATGQDTVYSLAGLEHLKVIKGGIIINATYAGEDLTVFERLEKTNELLITSKKVKTVRFPKLAVAHADLNFNQATAIQTLDFPELTAIDKGLRIYYVNSLANMNFPKLQEVMESITIEYVTNKLQSVDFPALQKVGGTFTMYSLNNVESVNFPALQTVNGNLSFPTSPILTTLNFPALQTIAGNLTIPNATNLTLTEQSFPELEYIKGELIVQLQSLTSLEAFRALDSIGRRLYLYNLPNLTSLGLSSLKAVNEINLLIVPLLTRVDVLGMVINKLSMSIGNGMELIGNDEFPGELVLGIGTGATISGFKKVGIATITCGDGTATISWLEEVSGLLDIRGNNTKELSLPNLRSAGGLALGFLYALETLNLPELTAITGYTSGTTTIGNFKYDVYDFSGNMSSIVLPKLESIVGNLSITNILHAETISFPVLQSITGKLELAAQSWQPNTTFTDLSGFSALKSANEVAINYFSGLKNFEPLKNVIPLLSTGTWKISGCGYNPTYRDMVDGAYSIP
jgi:hypothetical protein